MEWLTTWCRCQSLLLNVSTTNDMVTDFRNSRSAFGPLIINGVVVRRVQSIKFLRVYLAKGLFFTVNTPKIAQQRLNLPRKLSLTTLVHGHSGKHLDLQSHLLVQ